MQCDQDGERALRYVSGAMAEPEQTAFEEHFFACASCFREVQALQEAQETLTAGDTGGPGKTVAPPFRLPMRWLAAAATIVLAVVIWRLPRTPEGSPQRAQSSAQAPASAAQSPAPAPPAESRDDRIARLATIVPPRYVSLTTRAEEDQDAAAFDAAMTHYTAGRYARASEELEPIAARAPNLAHVQFFLGISRLLSGDAAKGRAALDASVAANTAPYSDEAHFYLAKAALKAKDLAAARRELRIAIEREAGPKGEAQRLLSEID
jgi:hypothetical protein